MVRILQVFDGFELRQDDAPAGSIPPASWKHRGGRASIEKAWPLSAITLYSNVRTKYFFLLFSKRKASLAWKVVLILFMFDRGGCGFECTWQKISAEWGCARRRVLRNRFAEGGSFGYCVSISTGLYGAVPNNAVNCIQQEVLCGDEGSEVRCMGLIGLLHGSRPSMFCGNPLPNLAFGEILSKS
jgi:hypothetical protein